MDSVSNLLVRILGDPSGFVKATETAGAASSTMGKTVSSMGSVGATLTRNLTLPLLAIGGASVKMAADFQQNMTLLGTQAGASDSQIKELSQGVLALGGTVEFGPNKLAQALYPIVSTGHQGADALNILKLASEGAAVGQADLIDTTNTLVGVLNTHIKGAENATVAMGNLNAIIGAGNMHMQDLNAAMGTGVMATAAAFGVSLDSVGAAMAELTSQGVPAVDAATHLRMTMTLMGSPTGAAAKALEAVGIGADDAAQKSSALADIMDKAGVHTSQLADDMRKPNGLSVAVQDLKDHLEKAGFSAQDSAGMIEKAFGGVKSGTTAIELSQDMEGLNKKFEQITHTSGNFEDAVKKQSETAKAKWAEMKSAADTTLVKIGSDILPALVPVLESVAKDITAMSDAFSKLSPGEQKTILDIGLALLALGPTLSIVSKLAGGIRGLSAEFSGAKTLASGGAVNFVITGALIDAGLIYADAKAFDTLKKSINDLNQSADQGQTQVYALNKRIADAPDEKTKAKWTALRDEMQKSSDESKQYAERYSGIKGALNTVGDYIATGGKGWDTFSGNLKNADEASTKAAISSLRFGEAITKVQSLFNPLAAMANKSFSDMEKQAKQHLDDLEKDSEKGSTNVVGTFAANMGKIAPETSKALSPSVSNAIVASLAPAVSQATAVGSEITNGFISYVQQVTPNVIAVFSGLGGAIRGATQGAIQVASVQGASLAASFQAGINSIQIEPPHVSGSLQGTGKVQATGGVVSYLAPGGFPGSPQGTDTVPTWLTPGEWVVRKEAADKLGPEALNQINQGRLPMVGGGGSTNVFNFNVNMGLYAGMPSEKREVAKDLARELIRVLRSRGINVNTGGAIEVQ